MYMNDNKNKQLCDRISCSLGDPTMIGSSERQWWQDVAVIVAAGIITDLVLRTLRG